MTTLLVYKFHGSGHKRDGYFNCVPKNCPAVNRSCIIVGTKRHGTIEVLEMQTHIALLSREVIIVVVDTKRHTASFETSEASEVPVLHSCHWMLWRSTCQKETS